MSNKLPEVERTDRICALIKDEIESHDAGDYPDEQELIEIQEDRDEGPEKEPEEHMWMHTHMMAEAHLFGRLKEREFGPTKIRSLVFRKRGSPDDSNAGSSFDDSRRKAQPSRPGLCQSLFYGVRSEKSPEAPD